MTTISSEVVFGSGTGMGKNQDPGSGINIPDPQHCWEKNRNRGKLFRFFVNLTQQ
jgi:hypothetical protein